MAAEVNSKFYLKSIHAEIDLFDRKLAHLLKYETFASEKLRSAAATRLSTKRGHLVDISQRLIGEGTEYSPSELPRSLRTESFVAAPHSEVAEDAAADSSFHPPMDKPSQPVYSGTSLDFRTEIEEYKAKRRKAAALAS